MEYWVKTHDYTLQDNKTYNVFGFWISGDCNITKIHEEYCTIHGTVNKQPVLKVVWLNYDNLTATQFINEFVRLKNKYANH